MYRSVLFARFSFLTTVGIVIGSTVGLLDWLRTPQEYKAVGHIQLDSPFLLSAPYESQDLGLNKVEMNLQDCVIVLQSSSVIDEAINLGRPLDPTYSFEDSPLHEFEAWLRDKDRLSIRPVSDNSTSRLIEVAFRCDSAEQSAAIVTAIIAGYEAYARKETIHDIQALLDRLSALRDELAKRKLFTRDEYSRLASNSKLIRENETYRDLDFIALERQSEALAELNEVRHRFSSALKSAEESVSEDPQNAESAIEMLTRIANSRFSWKDSEGNWMGDALTKSAASKTVDSKPISPMERFSTLLASMRLELNAMDNESVKLASVKTELETAIKKNGSMMENLGMIKVELDDIKSRILELDRQIDKLKLTISSPPSPVRRLDVPKIGQPDGPKVLPMVARGAAIGGASGMGLSMLSFLVGSWLAVVPAQRSQSA